MHLLIDSAETATCPGDVLDDRLSDGTSEPLPQQIGLSNQSVEPFQPALLHPIVQTAIRSVALTVIFLLLWGGYLTLIGQSNLPTAPTSLPVTRLGINRAELQDWGLMPGIGPMTAKKIVADRKANGPFNALDDLQRVPGIGPKTIEQLSPYCVSSATALAP